MLTFFHFFSVIRGTLGITHCSIIVYISEYRIIFISEECENFEFSSQMDFDVKNVPGNKKEDREKKTQYK